MSENLTDRIKNIFFEEKKLFYTKIKTNSNFVQKKLEKKNRKSEFKKL